MAEQVPHVFVGLPTYDGKRDNSIALLKLLRHAPCKISFLEVQSPLLAWTFNQLWMSALNTRPMATDHPLTHFLLMHADIIPAGDDWLLTMMTHMMRYQADVLSAVVPLKNEKGLTSTAFDTDLWRPERLTMTQLQHKPETFTAPDILLNTGLMLVDFTKPWIEEVCFTINDCTFQDDDGTFQTMTEPEDWNFSRWARSKGLSLWATKAVVVEHVGKTRYPNNGVWGQEYDVANRKG